MSVIRDSRHPDFPTPENQKALGIEDGWRHTANGQCWDSEVHTAAEAEELNWNLLFERLDLRRHKM